MKEYNQVASHLYKMGELTQDIFLTKIDGDKEKSLSQLYQVDGYPSVYIQQYINGTPGDLIQFEGNRTFKDLYAFIREIKPMVPERVASKERFEQLRAQVAHHLIVGLLFDKAPMVTVEVERSLHDM